MADPTNPDPNKAGPPKDQPAAGAEKPATSADQQNVSHESEQHLAEIQAAMQAAEDAVVAAVHGAPKIQDKQ